MVFALFTALPFIAAILIVVGTVHYVKEVKPENDRVRMLESKANDEFQEAAKEVSLLNKRWLMIEQSPESTLQIPSAKNYEIVEVSNFVKAYKQFTDKWNNSQIEKLTTDDKIRFVRNVSEVNGYFETFVQEIINRDKPNAKFIATILPSTQKMLS